MAPRAGKTTALAVPAILDAPGAVITTSNKADLWAATATLRAQRTSERVWVFDPQQIAYAKRTWWWNPLRDVITVEEAGRLASHFVQEIRDGNQRHGNDFWDDVGLDELNTATVATSRQTLYLLSKDGAGAAAPLVAALTDRVLREATQAAERAGGRLDPPLVVVLDEAANVCRIADLPDLYSHLGSRGIIPITILQSYKQGQRVHRIQDERLDPALADRDLAVAVVEHRQQERLRLARARAGRDDRRPGLPAE
jgi:type IV secretory pathway TraG/TraD family ATPase VirD4